MDTDEIDDILKNYSKEVINIQSLDKLYELYIDLTVKKSELHKLIHFCVDDYERKQYFSMIDLANTVQNVCSMKIRSEIAQKRENLRLDFEAEKSYIERDLKKYKSEAILFRKFSKEILPKKQYAQLDKLSKHCASLNVTASQYISNKFFNQLDFTDGEDDLA